MADCDLSDLYCTQNCTVGFTVNFLILLIQKNPEAVVENCSEAIKLNNKYTKALSRRATAAEQLGNLTMALEGKTQIYSCSCPEIIKLLSCSAQLRLKFILLINVKMPTIVGILTFISRINYSLW